MRGSVNGSYARVICFLSRVVLYSRYNMESIFMNKNDDALNENLEYCNELAKRVNHLADCVLHLNKRIDLIMSELGFIERTNQGK